MNVARVGPKWSMIASQLMGRTEHAVRNRWHRLQVVVGDAIGVEVGVDGVAVGVDECGRNRASHATVQNLDEEGGVSGISASPGGDDLFSSWEVRGAFDNLCPLPPTIIYLRLLLPTTPPPFPHARAHMLLLLRATTRRWGWEGSLG